jgi:hypothetical protein
VGDADDLAVPAGLGISWSDGEFLRAIRSVRGVHQGCVVGAFGSLVPYHLSCHRTNKQCPSMRIVADADDTVVGGPKSSIYGDFDTFCDNEKEDCDVEERPDKLKTILPSGGTDGIPQSFSTTRGGNSMASRLSASW